MPKKSSRLTDTHKVGRKDLERSPPKERERPTARGATNKSWSPGDKGPGKEGNSKGYGGSGGDGTGPSGPDEN